MRAIEIGKSTNAKTKAVQAYVEQNSLKNPWRQESRVVPGGYTVICGVSDRIQKIRRLKATEFDLAWLRTVVAWPDNGKTVQKAAESKLRVLTTLFEENGGDEPVDCSFCGSDKVVVGGRGHGRGEVWFVVCASCKKEGPTKPTEDVAIAHWNAEQRGIEVAR